jgi:hypothetical protein
MSRLGCVLLVLVAFAAGCTTSHWYTPDAPSGVVVGSGRFVTDPRPVAAFDRVSATAGIRVHVTQAAVESLEVTAEDNILPLVDAAVINGTLTLRWQPVNGGVSAHGVDVKVGARQVRAIEASAGAQIDMDRAAAAELSVTLSSGAIFTGAGVVERLDLDVSSGSHVSATEMPCRAAGVRLSSGSIAVIRVSDSLNVTASGASTLQYFGDPLVVQTVTDASIVRRLGP